MHNAKMLYSRTTPLLNGVKNGRSGEEIKEQLQLCTEIVIKLEKYNESLEDGKPQSKQARKQVYDMMVDCKKILQKSRELLAKYDGKDGPTFGRKLSNISERLEEVSSFSPIFSGN